MPIKIPDRLPAARILESENVFVMTENRALHQDIRPLKIILLNLMPTKVETETQLLRLLGNTPLQVEIELLQTASHTSKNTSAEHLLAFYKTFNDIKDNRYDGLIITGAPVEHIPFEDVNYWDELCNIMEWSKTHVYSTMHICWGALAGLYYHYGIDKVPLKQKLSGVYKHKTLLPLHPLVRGFDDEFFAPHSRYSGINPSVAKCTDALDILATSEDAGICVACDRSCRNIYISGHLEYTRTTLANEYSRDLSKGVPAPIPINYFQDNNPTNIPAFLWKSHSNLLFSNWLNYIVYQHTPYDLRDLK